MPASVIWLIVSETLKISVSLRGSSWNWPGAACGISGFDSAGLAAAVGVAAGAGLAGSAGVGASADGVPDAPWTGVGVGAVGLAASGALGGTGTACSWQASTQAANAAPPPVTRNRRQ